jgi:hypothetical protein
MLEFAVLPLGNVGEPGSRGLHQYLLNAQSCLVKHFLQHKKFKNELRHGCASNRKINQKSSMLRAASSNIFCSTKSFKVSAA